MKQKYIYPAFLLYAFLCFGLALVEIYKYPGIVMKFTHIDFSYFIYLLVVFSVLVKKPVSSRKNIVMFSTVVVIFCLVIFAVEAATFPNFMYSRFHLNPGGAINLAVIPLIILSSYYLSDKKILEKIALIFLGFWSVSNIFGTVGYASSKFVSQLKQPNATYDEKMRKGWGEFYDCMLIIKNNTPIDASIYIPPQIDVWQMEGNEYLVRYFLYPREIIHFGNISDASKSASPYFLYSWGYYAGDRKNGAWPYEKFKALTGVFVDNNEDFSFSKSVIFDRDLLKNKQTCGVIKPMFK